MELPVYMLNISNDETDNAEVDFVSLVDYPAIERNFLAFNKAPQNFAVQDEDKRVISGPAMIPDIPIFRSDNLGEYYAVFSKDAIAKIAYRFYKKGYQANINTDHSRDALVADSVFFESWIVDREKGKMPLKGFEDVPEGTWFLTAKINSEDTWAKIKSGEFRGFSVEGLFEYERVAEVDVESTILEQVRSIIDQIED